MKIVRMFEMYMFANCFHYLHYYYENSMYFELSQMNLNVELLQLLTPRTAEVFELNTEPKCDLKQHFKEFMSTTNKKDSSVARARLVYIENDKIIRGVVFKQYFSSHMRTALKSF